MDDRFSEFKEDFSLLVEAGFVAVKQLDEMSATKIFQALQAMSPDSMAPQLGMGYIHLNKLEVKEATAIFETVVAKEPENALAQTFLGMCFLLTKPKRKKGEELIKSILSKTEDPAIRHLAELSLEWADKDLSKNKSPFFTSQKEEAQEKEEQKT